MTAHEHRLRASLSQSIIDDLVKQFGAQIAQWIIEWMASHLFGGVQTAGIPGDGAGMRNFIANLLVSYKPEIMAFVTAQESAYYDTAVAVIRSGGVTPAPAPSPTPITPIS